MTCLFFCVCSRAALQKSDGDVKAMKKQAENLTVEYDRLLEEHAKLQVHTCTQQHKQTVCLISVSFPGMTLFGYSNAKQQREALLGTEHVYGGI